VFYLQVLQRQVPYLSPGKHFVSLVPHGSGSLTVLLCDGDGNASVWPSRAGAADPPVTLRVGGEVTACAAATQRGGSGYLAVVGTADGALHVLAGGQGDGGAQQPSPRKLRAGVGSGTPQVQMLRRACASSRVLPALWETSGGPVRGMATPLRPLLGCGSAHHAALRRLTVSVAFLTCPSRRSRKWQTAPGCSSHVLLRSIYGGGGPVASCCAGWRRAEPPL
jgi:hypothetical protein